MLLAKVVAGYAAGGMPVGSKALASDPDVDCGPSTIRNELAVLEEQGCSRIPTPRRAACPPTRARYFVDRLLPVARSHEPVLRLTLVRREIERRCA